jgi:hypothetical protein
LPTGPYLRSAAAWAGRFVIMYGVMLALWWLSAAAYLSFLARTVETVDAMGHGARLLRVVVVPLHGLVASGDWGDSLPIPQTVLGADLALAVALVLASSGSLWVRGTRRAVAAVGLVFIGHVATIVAQIALLRTRPGERAAMRVAWELWVAIYQAKVLPLAAWLMVCGLQLLEMIKRRERL